MSHQGPREHGQQEAEKMAQENALVKTSTEPVYPPFKKVLVIMLGLYLTTFLFALDRLIIGVAIPRITDEFNSLGDVGWYGSAYLLTTCAFGLFMGRVYTFYNPKYVYLSSLVVFEIGSALCGAAPNSTAFIVGRAVAGLGNAALFQGGVTIIVHITPLHKRPMYMGFIGMVFALASATAPLLGGAFTDGPGWRWCFYINLPLGAIVLLVLAFFLQIPNESLKQEPTTLKEKVTRLDPIGTAFFLPAIICLLLALQWGGVTYSWSDFRVILTLVLFGLCFLAFLAVQRWKGENATVPGRIFFNRSILAGIWWTFFIGGSMVVIMYFMPIWFQAIKGVSAVKSGIMMLPMVLGMTVASVGAGILTKKLGYYTPWMIACAVILPIGAGLITTFTPDTAHPQWIGYQVIFGFGLGLGQQQASVAAQTVLARRDVPIGASLMMFSQTLGGAIFLSIANNLFDSNLAKGLSHISGINVGTIATAGATNLRSQVPSTLLAPVLIAYNAALRDTFYLVTALTCLLIFAALSMEWKSIKQNKPTAVKSGEQSKEAPKEEV